MWSRKVFFALSPRMPWSPRSSAEIFPTHILLSASRASGANTPRSSAARARVSGSRSYASRSRGSRPVSSLSRATEEDSCPVAAQYGRMPTETAAVSEGERYGLAKPFDAIPGPRGVYSIPYIGTRLLFKPFSEYPIENVGYVFNSLHELYGPIVRVRLRRQWVVMLEDIHDVEQVFRHLDPVPYRGPVQPDCVYIERDNPRLRKLTNLNGEEWRRLRSPLNARMNRPSSTGHYLSSQEAVADDLTRWLYRLQHQDSRDMQQLFFRYAAESIGVVCFNKRLGFLSADCELDKDTETLLQCYKTINGGVSECMFGKRILYLFLRDPFYKRYKKARDGMLSYADQCIKAAMLEVERRTREGTLDPDEPNLLLSLLSEKTLGYMDVLGIMDTLMTAGSESTACGLQLFFHNLAANPDKQEKLAAEILGELGSEGSLTQEKLARMTYLKAAVKESMRCIRYRKLYQIHIPLPGGTRQLLPFNAVLSGYQIPKGTSALVNSSRMAKNPQYYHQPERFLPERWLRGEGGQREKTISAFSYVPFGFGPRMCIGRRFAEQEIYLAAVKALQKYRIGLQDDHDNLETTFTPFCAPARPLPFTFTPRT